MHGTLSVYEVLNDKNLFHPLRTSLDQDWWIWAQVCIYARYSILLNILGCHCAVYLHLWMIHACKYTIYTHLQLHRRRYTSRVSYLLFNRYSMLCALCDLNAVSDRRNS